MIGTNPTTSCTVHSKFCATLTTSRKFFDTTKQEASKVTAFPRSLGVEVQTQAASPRRMRTTTHDIPALHFSAEQRVFLHWSRAEPAHLKVGLLLQNVHTSNLFISGEPILTLLEGASVSGWKVLSITCSTVLLNSSELPDTITTRGPSRITDDGVLVLLFWRRRHVLQSHCERPVDKPWHHMDVVTFKFRFRQLQLQK